MSTMNNFFNLFRTHKYRRESLQGTNSIHSHGDNSAAASTSSPNFETVSNLYNDPRSEFELTATAVSGVVPNDTFTVDEAINSFGFGRLQIKLSLMTGICWMADAMEMMILSILSPALFCSWGISSTQQATITTVVFLGMMTSSALWAKFSDRYGRKTALLVAAILLFYYGFLSAFSPTYGWLLVLRGGVGVAVGAVAQGVTLYAEFIPMTQRGRSVVLLDSFWALGACLEVILATFVMPTLGWRWLLGLSALPLLLFVLCSIWMPESARFHAANGNYDKALATLKTIAMENKKPMPPGRLILDDIQDVKRGRIQDLFIPEMRKTTLLLWLIWFSCAFCYYGIVLTTTEMFRLENSCPSDQNNGTEIDCEGHCKVLSTTDYVDLLWTTLAEFPGIFITVIIIEKLGRKLTMGLEFVCYSLCVFPLLICFSSRRILTFLLFAARACVSATFQATYVYTPEVYPTTLRAIGLAMCSSVARLGAMTTPFVAQVMLKSSINATISIYGVVGLLTALAAFLLPIETKGQGLKETHRK
ncbi:hypothetical protein CHUAL_008357 [Chamberlinius hualienensis]